MGMCSAASRSSTRSMAGTKRSWPRFYPCHEWPGGALLVEPRRSAAPARPRLVPPGTWREAGGCRHGPKGNARMEWIKIPWRAGWRLVMVDEGLELSGYIAFAAFLSLFPFLIFLAALAGFPGAPGAP